jgi:methylmalonyl-CoA mutase N-terminal domain/subunit
MRQYAGFATAAESNERYRYLLGQRRQRALGGVRSADPARLRFRRAASARRSRQSRRRDRHDRRRRNAVRRHPARRGHRLDDDQLAGGDSARVRAGGRAPARHPVRSLGGTMQNDVLKEYVARGTYIFPPVPSMRLVTDVMAYCAQHVPNWNTISISGYHIREAGSTALQEIAFTLANAKAYLRAALPPDLTSTRSRRASRSSGTRTTTSSKRSRSFAPRARCGPRSCATSSVRTIRVADAALPHADRRLDADRARTARTTSCA